MKSLKLFIPVITAITIFLSSCEKVECCNPGPIPLVAKIHTAEGTDYLKGHTKESLKLFYIEDGKKNYLEPILNVYQDTTYLHAVNIHDKSAQGIRDFYLQVGDDIDTLHVVVVSSKKAQEEAKTFNYNGVPGKRVTAPSSGPIWYLKKH